MDKEKERNKQKDAPAPTTNEAIENGPLPEDQSESQPQNRNKSQGNTKKSVVTVMDKSGVKRKVEVERLKSTPGALFSEQWGADPIFALSTTTKVEPEFKKEESQPPPPEEKVMRQKKVQPEFKNEESEPPPPEKKVMKQPKIQKPKKSVLSDIPKSVSTSSTVPESGSTEDDTSGHIPKSKRKKVLKGTYKKYFDPLALDTELVDTGSSISYTDSSGEHQGEEDGRHPDMNWFSKEDAEVPKDEEDEEKIKEKVDNQKLMNVLAPYMWTCFILGRLPFKFSVDEKTGVWTCTVERKSGTFVAFVITSILMTLALIEVGSSFCWLVFSKPGASENATNYDYLRLEVLLMTKWWLPISIFLFSLVMTVVGSFSIIWSGPAMAEYITLWMNHLSHFDNIEYPVHLQTLYHIAWAHPISSFLNLLAILSLYFAKSPAFQEPVQAITLLFFRRYKDHLYFEVEERRPLVYPLVAIFMSYVFFSSRSIVFLIIIFSRGIVYLAVEWNTRLAIILRKLNPRTASARLKKLKPLKYEDMLKDHQKIVELVAGISGTFVVILVMYALIECFKLTLTLFATSQDLAITEKPEFDTTFVNFTKIRYQKHPSDEGYEITYHMIHTVMSFAIVAWATSSAGDMVMAGFDVVRRHGLLLANGGKERKFIMSLIMSFNSASPHVICPGNWFLFDRGFIMSVFCGSMAIYSLLIGLELVHKVEKPIIFKCLEESKNARFCLGVETVNFPGGIQEKDKDAIINELNKNVNEVLAIPPVNGDGFLPPVTETAFEDHCIEYCKGSLIRRPIAYNSDGIRQKPLPGEMGLDDCILNPYAHINNTTQIYNCLKIPANRKDNCNQPDLSRDPHGLIPETTTQYSIPIGTDLDCFEDRTKHGNPLENCNQPWHLLTIRPRPICPTPNPPAALTFGILAFVHSASPTIPTAVILNPPLCDIKQMGDGDPTKVHTYEMNKGLLESFEFKFNGKIYTVWRMLGMTMRKVRSKAPTLETNRIPLIGSALDKLYRPYAYIHPKKMRNFTIMSTVLTEYTYGYYDCLGNPMLYFDDCGNLAFPLVTKDSAGNKNATSGAKEVVTSPGGKDYNCYKSPIPDYKCGLPEDLVDEGCRRWKEFLTIDVSTFNFTTP